MEHYLDNAATTKPCAEAAAAVMSCISAHYGNPSSLSAWGLPTPVVALACIGSVDIQAFSSAGG